jgi:hypothetical protein
VSVTEVKQALGAWSVRLGPDTPRTVLDLLGPFGHIVVMPGRVDVEQMGQGLLTASRYVGVLRSRRSSEDGVTELAGAGLAFWLGDEDGKGPVWETAKTFSASTFANTIRALLPNSGAVVEGTLFSASGSYTGSHIYETPRQSITYVTDTFGTSVTPVSWRVNGDATLDAGPDSSLFVTAPSAMLVRKRDAGRDMFLTGMSGNMELGTDVEDYTTKVLLLAEGEGTSTVTAQASIIPPYLDLRGNLVSLTRLVSEFETDVTNAVARAQLQLNRFTTPRFSVNLSTDEYDVKGQFKVGDTIYVYDPDIGFADTTKEVTFRGRVLNPKAINVTEMTWPIPPGWTVAFRTTTGQWVDLSDYYVAESGSTTVTVGEFSRSINDSSAQPVGSRPVGDSSIPAAPVFGAASTSSYQSGANGSGLTFAQIQLTWTQPLNTDGSTVLDGDHYEIRYRTTNSTITTSWQNISIGWGTTLFLVTGLIPGTSYDFQIRAVDAAVPPNFGAFSSTFTTVTSADAIAPSTPAAPVVAASRIAVQVTHNLGNSASGTFNLEADLDRLEVHAGASASFTPDNTTRIGKLPATIANIRASIPAVGTFPIESTAPVWIKVLAVDTSGNSSGASVGASATALLVDNAHISDLTVSKVTAGTIAATWINAGLITTAVSGARTEMSASGFGAYNSGGTKTVDIKSSDGSVTILGRFRTGVAGGGSAFLDMSDSGDRSTINFYTSSASANQSAFINSPQDAASASMLGLNTGAFTYVVVGGTQTAKHRLFLANTAGIVLETYRISDGLNIGGRVQLDNTAARVQFYTGANLETGGQLSLEFSTGFLLYTASGVVKSQVYVTNTQAVVASPSVSMELGSTIGFIGNFANNWTGSNGAGDATISGSRSSGFASGTSFAVTYGATSTSRPGIVYGYFSVTSANHRLSAFGTTGFTVTTSSSLVCDLNYWAFRHP